MQKTIILDRDGVINVDSPNYIRTPEEWHAIPGSLESITRLNDAGYLVAVATNQSGIGRGYYTNETYLEIEKKMVDALAELGGHFDAIAYCPHHPDEDCDCRKPKIGLMTAIASRLELDLTPENTYVIGDSLRDLQAAISANCTPVLVLTGNGQKTLDKWPDNLPKPQVFPCLSDAVDSILTEDYRLRPRKH